MMMMIKRNTRDIFQLKNKAFTKIDNYYCNNTILKNDSSIPSSVKAEFLHLNIKY